MDDVTSWMDEYRECVRHLWNTYFRRDAEPSQDWELRDEFNEAASILFRALVLRKLNRADIVVAPDHRANPEPLMFLRLKVDAPRSTIMVNRELTGGYWNDPLEEGDLDLRFIHFFDWWTLGFRNFELYRVRIVASERYPRVVGKDALVPVGTAIKVLHDPTVPAPQARATSEPVA